MNAFTQKVVTDKSWLKQVEKERKRSSMSSKTAHTSPYGKKKSLEYLSGGNTTPATSQSSDVEGTASPDKDASQT